jgi:ABC-type sulfate transport system permease component
VSRIVLLAIVAFLVASSSVLWAGTYKAAQEMSDLLRSVPVTIAASAVSISASSVTPLAYLIAPYTSECSDPAVPICPLPLDRTEFS